VEIRSAIDFYERHPISCDIILAKLRASRGHLEGLTPDELFPHDQARLQTKGGGVKGRGRACC
jgi:hypothetical protein